MKTFNRTPTSVYVPTESKVEHSYFNYTQWKGKCTDKNYIGVDQETFEDCKNVYVDSDGVLRSRPMVRIATEVGFQNVMDMWKFGDWTVYKVLKVEMGFTGYQLYFQHDGTLSDPVTVPEKFKLVLADEKIFMFGETELKYFDLTNSTWNNAKIYKPIISTTALGVESPLEAKNELTDSYRKQYIWSRSKPTDLSSLYGKTVEVKIDDTSWTLTPFKKNQQLTFVKPTFTFGEDSMLDGIPMVSVSSDDRILLTKKRTVTSGSTSYVHYDIFYSVDGISFEQLPAIATEQNYNNTGIPSFSNDGTTAVVMSTIGPFAISLVVDNPDVGARYPTWTLLTSKFGEYSEYVVSSNLNSEVAMDEYDTFAAVTVKQSSSSGIVYIYTTWVTGDVAKLYTIATSGENVSIDLTAHFALAVCRDQNYDDKAYGILSYISKNTNTNAVYTNIGVFSKYTLSDGTDTVGFWVSTNLTPEPTTTSDLPSKIHRTVSIFKQSGQLYFALITKSSVSGKSFVSVGNTIYHDSGTTESQRVPHGYQSYENIAALTNSVLKTSNVGLLLVDNNLIYNQEKVTTAAPIGTPLAATSYIYSCKKVGDEYQVYSSNFSDQIKLIETIDSTTQKNYLFDCEAELQDYFISFGKRLLVNAPTPNAEDFEWYFPVYKTQSFDYEITGLHPISTTELAVFQEDSIYYAVPTTITYNNAERSAYTFYKSRLPLGCAKGCDIVTSFDGKYTIFSTVRGLVAMAYQDFVSSSEQALNFLSDTILEDYTAWATGAVKIMPYKYWLLIYRQNDHKSFVYDMRNGSWWDIEYTKNVHKVLPVGQKVYVVIKNNRLHCLNTSDNDYHDEHAMIDWYLVSQKLHFNAVNYYKHVVNMTLSAISTATKEFTCKLNVNIFRKAYNENVRPDLGIAYNVEMVRVYVRRINYMKLNEFQFILRSDDEAVQQLPLSLTNISIKHRVTGQVR